MALDLEEQEQVAELTAWWQQHGNLVVSAITAAAIAFAGWQGWRWYERSQASQAGALYDTLGRSEVRLLHELKRVRTERRGA